MEVTTITSSSISGRNSEVIVITIPDTPPPSAPNSDDEEEEREDDVSPPKQHTSQGDHDQEQEYHGENEQESLKTQVRLKETAEGKPEESQKVLVLHESKKRQVTPSTVHLENGALQSEHWKMQLDLERSQLQKAQLDLHDTHATLQSTKHMLQDVEIMLHQDTATELDELKQERYRLSILYENSHEKSKSKDQELLEAQIKREEAETKFQKSQTLLQYTIEESNRLEALYLCADEKIRSKDQELLESQNKLKEEETKLQESQKALQEMKKEQQATLQNINTTLQQENEAHQSAKMNMERDIRSLHNTVLNYQGGNAALWQSNTRLHHEYSNLRVLYDQLQTEHRTASCSGSNALQQGYNKLHETNEKLLAGDKELRVSYAALLNAKEQLQINHLAISDAHALLQEDHRILRADYEKLKNDNETLRSSPATFKNVKVSTTIAAVLTNATSTQTETESKLQIQIGKLEQELIEARKECFGTLETKRILRGVQAELRETKHKLHEEQTALHYLNASLQREQKRDTNTFSALQKERDELCKERVSLRSANNALRTENAIVHCVNESLQKERPQPQQTLLGLQCNQSALQSQGKQLQTELDELTKELNCIEVMYETAVAEVKSKDDTLETINIASDKKINEVQLQLQQLTQERDDAIRIIEGMKIELQRRDRLTEMYENVVEELKSKDVPIETINVVTEKKLNELQLQLTQRIHERDDAKQITEDTKIELHQRDRPAASYNQVNKLQLQLQQLIQERDDAVRLTADMEVELHRLSNEVDYYEEQQQQLQLLAPPSRGIKKRKR